MRTHGRTIVAISAFLTTLGTTPAMADYLAYAVGKSTRIPLPESIDHIQAGYLLNIDWGDYDGARARVGVLEVDNTSTSSSFTMDAPGGGSYTWSVDHVDQVPVNGIEAIVIDAISRTGRFRLVERHALGAVLDEQDLASSGRVARPSGAATGNVLGAEYLVQVVVTDYEARTSGTSGGLGGFLRDRVPVVGGVGISRGTGRVGMNFRLIDAETSEVMYTRQIESQIDEAGLTFGGAGFSNTGALGGFISDYSKTPIGQAVIAGINKGVYELVKEIGAAPASGTVIKAEGDQVWINIGSDAVSTGDVLRVMQKGEELIDPDTGLNIGSSDTEIGRIQVSETKDKFSVARTVSMNGQTQRGDKVISTAEPPRLEFAAQWDEPGRGRF